MTPDEKLAFVVKAWRGKLPQRDAAALLGIPKRTFENIEQGRGFPYPRLLQIAMQTISIDGGKHAENQNAASQ